MGPVATAMGEIYQFTLSGNMPQRLIGKNKIFNRFKNITGMDNKPYTNRVPRC